jgi:branched-chain amino acid transport system permease protein
LRPQKIAPLEWRAPGNEAVMSEDLEFLLSLVLSGASIGLMYSLIALGFVLVYKATDAINFAQGEFVMLAGFVVVVVLGFEGMPLIAAIVAVLAAMIGFGFGLERVVLRPLLGRPVVAVIMATIGLAAILRGLGPVLFGKEVRAISLPIGDEPITLGPASLPPIQVLGAVVAIGFFIGFTWFFKKSRMGVAMRAVADNQQVAQAMGIDVERYFALAWAMAGIVSALGGVVWGAMLGVDVQLALVGLKVFPVVIMGGLDSIGGALVGGLIIGIIESLAAGYLDPYVGGGTKDFAPYVVMILMLMVRPYGIFGRRQIERV